MGITQSRGLDFRYQACSLDCRATANFAEAMLTSFSPFPFLLSTDAKKKGVKWE